MRITNEKLRCYSVILSSTRKLRLITCHRNPSCLLSNTALQFLASPIPLSTSYNYLHPTVAPPMFTHASWVTASTAAAAAD